MGNIMRNLLGFVLRSCPIYSRTAIELNCLLFDCIGYVSIW